MIKKDKHFLSNSKEGFTLIELIIVIFIIGLLTTIVTISISGVKSRGRDIKRVSEITQLQIALDNYNKIEGRYPENLILGEVLVGSSTGITFMSKVPINSSYYDMDCYAEGYDYSYDVVNNEYEIAFCLEKKVDNYSSGPKCAVPGKIFDSSCEGGTSSCGSQVADSQGNLYNTVQIGEQCWFQENLKYLPMVHNNSEYSASSTAGLPAYGVYGYNGNNINMAKLQANYINYGVLYNWYAVDQVNICPIEWHVPNNFEWAQLTDWLVSGGGVLLEEEGKALKASSTSLIPWNGDNSSGFTALPAGARVDGEFYFLDDFNYLWSSSETSFSPGNSDFFGLDNSPLFLYWPGSQAFGFSVRCLKD